MKYSVTNVQLCHIDETDDEFFIMMTKKDGHPDSRNITCIAKNTPAFKNFLEKCKTPNVLSKEELDYFYSKTVRFTVDGKRLFDGQMLFDNMDSKGIPLDVALMQCDVLTNGNFAIDWIRFIDRALERKWKVYQIHDRMLYAMKESDVFSQDYIDQVMYRMKVHICQTDPEFQRYLLTK